MSRGRGHWDGRTRYTVVTDSGFRVETYDAAKAQRSLRMAKDGGWMATIVAARTKDERDRKAREHWDRCREQRKADELRHLVRYHGLDVETDQALDTPRERQAFHEAVPATRPHTHRPLSWDLGERKP